MINRELIEALDELEKEKEIDKEVIFTAIESALVSAYYNNHPKTDNVKATVSRETGEFSVFITKTVVEEVTNQYTEIDLDSAKKINKKVKIGDTVDIKVQSDDFSRVAATTGKNVIVQNIRQEEKRVIYDKYSGKAKDVITGIVEKADDKRYKVNLGKADAFLYTKDIIPGEKIKIGDRIKLYVTDVKIDEKSNAPRISVSRTHPELVKKLFEAEVAEIQQGIIEIKSVAREAGSRTKIAVCSNRKKIDPVGSCVGVNGARVAAVVDELNGEKIDIINWDENPAIFINNAMSPAKVVSVEAYTEEKTAEVVVPDNLLSLAIGKEGQNARLAAKLTGYKIDIKSESQKAEMDKAAEENAETEQEAETMVDAAVEESEE